LHFIGTSVDWKLDTEYAVVGPECIPIYCNSALLLEVETALQPLSMLSLTVKDLVFYAVAEEIDSRVLLRLIEPAMQQLFLKYHCRQIVEQQCSQQLFGAKMEEKASISLEGWTALSQDTLSQSYSQTFADSSPISSFPNSIPCVKTVNKNVPFLHIVFISIDAEKTATVIIEACWNRSASGGL